MGQRSQIYVRYDGRLIIANYYQWNYGDLMISRSRGIIEYLRIRQNYWDLIFKDRSYIKKISRVCDTNFDCRDIAISCDIVQEWKEQFSDTPFNETVFYDQDNNDGQLFIDITADGTIKYAFTQNPDYTKLMDCESYMNWDYGDGWDKEMDKEMVDICKGNIAYIRENTTLLTFEELYGFINGDYEQKEIMQ